MPDVVVFLCGRGSRAGRQKPPAPQRPPRLIVPAFAVGDGVSHQVFGVGRVVRVEAHLVEVDFPAGRKVMPEGYLEGHRHA